MNELTTITTIKQVWYSSDKEEYPEIKPSHVEALEESGLERVIEMMREGFTSGELHGNIHKDDDPEDGVQYEGHWEINTEHAEDEPIPTPSNPDPKIKFNEASVNDPEIIKNAVTYF